MTGKRISLEALKAGYGTKIVLNDVTFGVEPGSILTLMGPNGSGKSTLIKTISRQISPLGGSVYIEKQNISSMPDRDVARQMSVMLTERPDPEYMSCRDVVEMGRLPYTGTFGILSREDHRVVDEAMDMVHIRALSDTSFSDISDGQRQRVMLARAIAQEPSVLIMDEPTTFLDIKYKIDLLTILKDLVHKKQIAVILSLHELELAGKISDYIACVNDGRIIAYGPTEEIFTEDRIQKLYGITKGRYIESFGSIELAPVLGEPKVFVICGGGSAIKTFHRLWRQDIPFACGIINENDMEYPIAKALASRVISAPAFEPAEESHFAKARELIDSCERVICNIETFGTYNGINKRLFEYAKSMGKCE